MDTTLTAAGPEQSTTSPANPPAAECQAMYLDTPWTWRDRLRFRLMPSQPCRLPPASGAFKDVIEAPTIVSLDWMDRLRILVTGHLKVHVRIVCEHEVGATVAASVAYPIWTPRN